MSFFTYILYSNKTDKYYTGSCSDLTERLKRHNAGATISTKSGRPWTLAYFETFLTRQEALHCELQIKKMKSRKYIEELINRTK